MSEPMAAGSNPAGGQDVLAQDFVRFALDCGVLRFGEFKTKAGRLSPYFFNAGLFEDGAKMGRLAAFYARRLLASGLQFDMIFGPAYKGIPLGAAVAAIIAACYIAGGVELYRYRQASNGLRSALSDLSSAKESLAPWLERVPMGLRNAVRLRVEGERTALPAPVLTPYLVGLLVLLPCSAPCWA